MRRLGHPGDGEPAGVGRDRGDHGGLLDMLAVDRLGKEIDLHLYIPEFSRVAVDEFVSLYRQAAG